MNKENCLFMEINNIKNWGNFKKKKGGILYFQYMSKQYYYEEKISKINASNLENKRSSFRKK